MNIEGSIINHLKTKINVHYTIYFMHKIDVKLTLYIVNFCKYLIFLERWPNKDKLEKLLVIG